MNNCDYLVPRFAGADIRLDDGDTGECLLRKGHAGEHLVKTSGGYYLWLPEDNFCVDDEGKVCDCDFIECYVSRNITDARANQLLAKDGAGTD